MVAFFGITETVMSKHSIHSSYREKLIEHLFVGELLKLSWQRSDCDLEISTPEVDRAGYDVIAETRGIIRHIQLKASKVDGKTYRQKVHLRLSAKPSGCIVWIYFNEATLALGPFLFFGDIPGKPLPNIEDAKIARHSKGNRDGHKGERPNIRELLKGQFVRYESLEQIYEALFGP